MQSIVAEFLMPPGIWMVLLMGLAILHRFTRRCSSGVLWGGGLCLVALWLTATPLASQWLIQSTQAWMKWPKPLEWSQLEQGEAEAIVILGGGTRRGALDYSQYGNQDLASTAWQRVRYAAQLHRHQPLPIAVSGGLVDGDVSQDATEADLMQRVLKAEYGLEVRWREDQSRNTHENALHTARLLKADGVQTVYLVTHFWHMPRAQEAFEKMGLRVIPIPHGYRRVDPRLWRNWLPSDLVMTRQIWHECLGLLWYRWRY